MFETVMTELFGKEAADLLEEKLSKDQKNLLAKIMGQCIGDFCKENLYREDLEQLIMFISKHYLDCYGKN